MVDDIRKSLRSLAEDLPYLGLIKSMQGMVESVFVKKDCKWKGCEMLILQKKLNYKTKGLLY